MKLMILKPEGSSYEMYDAICEKIVSVGFKEPQTVYCRADLRNIAEQMRRLSKKCDILIVTGEMGDQGCARQAAASAFGYPLAFSERAWDYIKKKCSFTGEDPNTFANCAVMPQYSMPVAGSGVIPACFAVNDDLALLMFDEKRDQKLLERFESLLITLTSNPDPEPEPAPAPVATAAPRAAADKPAAKHRRHSAASQPYRAKNLRRRAKKTRRNAMILLACIALSAVLVIAAVCSLLSDISENSSDDGEIKKASVAIVDKKDGSKQKDTAKEKDEPEKKNEPEKLPAQSSSKPAEASSKPAESSQPSVSSAPPVPQSSAPSQPTPPEPSSSAAPQQTYTEVPVVAPSQSSSPEPAEDEPEQHVTTEYTYDPEEEEEYERPSGNTSGLPKADRDAFDEKLSYINGNGSTKRMNAYDLVCQILMNETNGIFEPEALKAHAVATYSMLKYNNERGTAPSVLLKSNVTESIEDAVSEVLGVAAYYNGEYANTVYHSTSSGRTTSSESVWGGYFPYLVSVNSSYDSDSPYYETHYSIDSDKLADLVDRVYGIELDGDPDDWFEIKHDAPGGYVGTVIIGGETHGQGGTWGRKEITGRSFRENLLSYSIRSHCFDLDYDDDDDQFSITTYGYGHGVGMSQFGAHFMAQEGYNFVEILEHYYTGVEVY
ncbi:MAG: SpoIID/LytB domain-containing protein [Oscillospiraceae bacterium]|nr:SpoIID/LytB domain-containing protein [Oscillospiraceae bacterium]